MFEHQDILEGLNQDISLKEKLRYVHGVLCTHYPFIDRVSVALYDAKTDSLRTFVHSSGADHPLDHYSAQLSDSRTLWDILDQGRPRVVQSLEIFGDGHAEHSERIRKQGYRGSYTMPMFADGIFFGFLFFNSYEENVFDSDVLRYLDLFGHLIGLIVINEVSSIHTLLAALKTARHITSQRDFETGVHLDRMSRYARLIANALAEEFDFSDEYIEHVFLFAPLHDIGKIAVPDNILLKPGKLDAGEFEQMKAHVLKGREIIDEMLDNFGLEGFKHLDMLRNITQCHHEAMDGTGYPLGLSGEEIPIEARIIAVADVFDALTSKRPYKEAWDNQKAFSAMQRLAGISLDARCVGALLDNVAEIEAIQARFREDVIG